MTSLIAWIAVDQRAPSALYMASDSQISWGSRNSRWDAGRKLFSCKKHPDIFGYAGDVVFPSLVLGQIAEAADAGLLFQPETSNDERHAIISTAIKSSHRRHTNARISSFEILHGARSLSGSRANFRLWCVSFNAKNQRWSDREIDVPHDKSALLAAHGSGATFVKYHATEWEKSDQGGTSRAIFSAFCDSIKGASDPYSGGAPQLIGMYHTRMPQVFGVAVEGQRYFQGFPLPASLAPNSIEWRDELFQRIDPEVLRVVSGAQRHIRPTGR